MTKFLEATAFKALPSIQFLPHHLMVESSHFERCHGDRPKLSIALTMYYLSFEWMFEPWSGIFSIDLLSSCVSPQPSEKTVRAKTMSSQNRIWFQTQTVGVTANIVPFVWCWLYFDLSENVEIDKATRKSPFGRLLFIICVCDMKFQCECEFNVAKMWLSSADSNWLHFEHQKLFILPQFRNGIYIHTFD